MQQIPKIIHYCWFGGNPLPELALRCIESWKRYCPDYEIVRWDESNFDVNAWEYTKEAYAAKKWAFVSDVARLYAMVNFGGIYLDTDMELVKPIDDLLDHPSITGCERAGRASAGIMGCVKGFPLYREFLDRYSARRFLNADGTYNYTTIVDYFTELCVESGLESTSEIQFINNMAVFPPEYFYPLEQKTGKVLSTKNTRTIHWFNGSWLPEEERSYIQLRGKLRKCMPNQAARYISKFLVVFKYRGISGVISEMKK